MESTILYGQEIKSDYDDIDIGNLSYQDIDMLALSEKITHLSSQIQEGVEAYQSIMQLSSLYPDINNINIREKTLLQLSLNKATNSLGMEEISCESGLLMSAVDNIYLAIVTALDILFEMIGKFFRWFKEQIKITTQLSPKITSGIRHLINNSPKSSFSFKIKGKDALLFMIDGKFDIGETIALYSSLFTLYSSNRTFSHNVNNALKVKPFEKKYIDIIFDPVFPVIRKKNGNRDGIIIHYGPALPNGYELQAILPDDKRKFQPEELNVLLDLSDISIEKVRDSKLDKKDVIVNIDKVELEKLNVIQTGFDRSCISILNFIDGLTTYTSKLRRHYRKVDYKHSANYDPQFTSYMSMNLSAINFISRSIKEPFFTINRMAQITDKVLLSILYDFVKKELKEIK